jgi:hypothetical protein
MYLIASSIFLIPLTLMCYVICCMKDENVSEPVAKPADANGGASNNNSASGKQASGEKVSEKKKRDKIE